MTSDFIRDYPLIYALSCIVFWYVCHLTICLTVSYKPKNFWYILSIWFIGSGMNAGILVIHDTINSYIAGGISIMQCFLTAQFYEGSKQNKSISAIFAWGMTSVFEVFSAYFLIFLHQTDMQSFASNSSSIIVSHTLSKLFPLFLLSAFPFFSKSKENKRDFLSMPQGIAFFTIPILSVCLSLSLHKIHLTVNLESDNLVVWVSFSLLFINAIFFWLFDAFSDSMKKHYEHKMLELQVGYYENLYHNVGEERMAIATLRHNIKNDLISLESSLKSGDIVELQRQLHQLLEDKSLENRRNSIIPIVDAVLSYKIPQGEKMGVTIHHQQILNPQLEVSHSHLANILGNLLDNGMEYVSHLPEIEQRKVDLQMKKSGQNLTITVSNPFRGELEYHEDLPLSRKREGKSHGIGLVTVQKLVKELGGYFSVEVEKSLEGQVFTAKVVIYQCFP